MNLQTIKQRFGIIGNVPSLNHALTTATQVAATDLTVLIEGESGVGKEVFSKIIHSLSARKHNKFIAINCGAIPDGTINSELFGHAKGAFTGASGDRKGYFETVNGGTIFLDEIGEMPLQTQTFLLRVLEQGEFVKVGSSVVEKTDVRVVAATNVKLKEKVQQGKFREDLFYRLSTVPIKVPPLRERGEDINLLFRKFASDFAEQYNTKVIRLDDKAQLLLENYAWPGNIRELRNIAKRVSLLCENQIVTAEELLRFIPDALQRNLPALAGSIPSGNGGGNGNTGFYEREILFKFLYDMKKDLNDMKALIAELAQTNNLRMPANLHTHTPEVNHSANPMTPANYENDLPLNPEPIKSGMPSIILDNNNFNLHASSKDDRYGDVEEIEESLSIEDMEQDLITKALNKHKGHRKEAAKELGISERTLYRKIKLYNISI